MSGLVLVVCSGLLIYWLSRTALLLREAEKEVRQTLEIDLGRGRKLLHVVRLVFIPL